MSEKEATKQAVDMKEVVDIGTKMENLPELVKWYIKRCPLSVTYCISKQS